MWVKLLGVDGVVWRTPETKENERAFGKLGNDKRGSVYHPMINYATIFLTK
ncbi:MAG: hypothetical protein RPR97_13580 [Colwellia sp.]